MLPILYQSPDLTLYSYPLLMGLGWGIAYQIYFGLLDDTVSKVSAQILYWGVFLSAWIGSKVLFLLTLPPGSQDVSGNASFWIGGGFVFYGGLLAAILFLLVFRLAGQTVDEKNTWPMLPALSIGHAIGRVGCFLAGCCYGKETDLFWGVHLHGQDRHPTQIIEALGLFLLGIYLVKSRQPKRVLFSQYFIVYGILRFIVELLRGDIIRGQWGPFTPSQWISLGLVILGIGVATIRNQTVKVPDVTK